MTRLLASVRDPAEARLAVEGGADLIDLKEPARGALGALDPEAQLAAVGAVGGRCPVSATIGDHAGGPVAARRAVAATAARGVDFVKVGLFERGAALPRVVEALGAEARRGVSLVAVMFADRGVDVGVLPLLSRGGFTGVMLDTADKAGGGLTALWSAQAIGRFVAAGREHALLTGLAGALRPADVDGLLALEPDYLGFRGALCGEGDRAGGLCPAALERLRARIPRGPSEAASTQVAARS